MASTPTAGAVATDMSPRAAAVSPPARHFDASHPPSSNHHHHHHHHRYTATRRTPTPSLPSTGSSPSSTPAKRAGSDEERIAKRRSPPYPLGNGSGSGSPPERASAGGSRRASTRGNASASASPVPAHVSANAQSMPAVASIDVNASPSGPSSHPVTFAHHTTSAGQPTPTLGMMQARQESPSHSSRSNSHSHSRLTSNSFSSAQSHLSSGFDPVVVGDAFGGVMQGSQLVAPHSGWRNTIQPPPEAATRIEQPTPSTSSTVPTMPYPPPPPLRHYYPLEPGIDNDISANSRPAMARAPVFPRGLDQDAIYSDLSVLGFPAPADTNPISPRRERLADRVEEWGMISELGPVSRGELFSLRGRANGFGDEEGRDAEEQGQEPTVPSPDDQEAAQPAAPAGSAPVESVEQPAWQTRHPFLGQQPVAESQSHLPRFNYAASRLRLTPSDVLDGDLYSGTATAGGSGSTNSEMTSGPSVSAMRHRLREAPPAFPPPRTPTSSIPADGGMAPDHEMFGSMREYLRRLHPQQYSNPTQWHASTSAEPIPSNQYPPTAPDDAHQDRYRAVRNWRNSVPAHAPPPAASEHRTTDPTDPPRAALADALNSVDPMAAMLARHERLGGPTLQALRERFRQQRHEIVQRPGPSTEWRRSLPMPAGSASTSAIDNWFQPEEPEHVESFGLRSSSDVASESLQRQMRTSSSSDDAVHSMYPHGTPSADAGPSSVPAHGLAPARSPVNVDSWQSIVAREQRLEQLRARQQELQREREALHGQLEREPDVAGAPLRARPFSVPRRQPFRAAPGSFLDLVHDPATGDMFQHAVDDPDSPTMLVAPSVGVGQAGNQETNPLRRERVLSINHEPPRYRSGLDGLLNGPEPPVPRLHRFSLTPSTSTMEADARRVRQQAELQLGAAQVHEAIARLSTSVAGADGGDPVDLSDAASRHARRTGQTPEEAQGGAPDLAQSSAFARESLSDRMARLERIRRDAGDALGTDDDTLARFGVESSSMIYARRLELARRRQLQLGAQQQQPAPQHVQLSPLTSQQQQQRQAILQQRHQQRQALLQQQQQRTPTSPLATEPGEPHQPTSAEQRQQSIAQQRVMARMAMLRAQRDEYAGLGLGFVSEDDRAVRIAFEGQRTYFSLTRPRLSSALDMLGGIKLHSGLESSERTKVLRAVARAVNLTPLPQRRKYAQGVLVQSMWEEANVEGDKDECCAICQDDYTPDAGTSVTPCNHMYHTDCLDSWIKTPSASSCPMCRRDLAILSVATTICPEGAETARKIWMDTAADSLTIREPIYV